MCDCRIDIVSSMLYQINGSRRGVDMATQEKQDSTSVPLPMSGKNKLLYAELYHRWNAWSHGIGIYSNIYVLFLL